MFYKVTKKKSDVYKKLHALRTKEKAMEEHNVKALEEKTGLKWDKYLGYQGQQNFNRVTTYLGFEFLEPKNLDPKIWREHKTHKGLFEPNLRTKLGREMNSFIHDLKGHSFMKILEVLGLKESPSGRYQLPYFEIEKEAIILSLDDSCRPKDKNIVEITSKEFAGLQK